MTRTCGQPGRLVAPVALSGPIGCLAFDGLNETMLTQIVVNWELLHSPACASELDTARGDVIRARQLDNLYRKALSLATQSYCQG
jgi:chorismate mutase